MAQVVIEVAGFGDVAVATFGPGVLLLLGSSRGGCSWLGSAGRAMLCSCPYQFLSYVPAVAASVVVACLLCYSCLLRFCCSTLRPLFLHISYILLRRACDPRIICLIIRVV